MEKRFKDHLWGIPARRSKEEDGKLGKDTEGVSGRSWETFAVLWKEGGQKRRERQPHQMLLAG